MVEWAWHTSCWLQMSHELQPLSPTGSVHQLAGFAGAKCRSVMLAPSPHSAHRTAALAPAGVKASLWVVSGTLSFPCQPDSVAVMVGPGTGCAPFRAFVEERVWGGRAGGVVFFGCRYKAADFFFADEWLPLEAEGRLKLFTAFSRDQVPTNGCLS